MIRLVTFLLILHVSYAAKKTIECRFGQENFQYLTGSYTCTVAVNPVILEPFEEDIEFIGEHLGGRYNNDVDVFNTGYRCSPLIHYFPRRMNETFENLDGIIMVNTGLKEIHREDIESWSKLSYVDLSSNKIEVIEEDLFSGNPQMKHLFLQYNQIKFIHPTAVNNLSKLKNLNFEGNVCVKENEVSSPRAADLGKRVAEICNGSVSIYDLYIQQKVQVKKIPSKDELQREINEQRKLNDKLKKEIGEKQKLIEELQKQNDDLSQQFNKIEPSCKEEKGATCNLLDLYVTDKRTFISNVRNLGGVDYDEVVIDKQNCPNIPRKFSDYFINIKKLTVMNSKLEQLKSEELDKLSNLEELKVSENVIATIDYVLPHDKLKILDLSSNGINLISEGSFDKLDNLIELNLGSNKLTNLPAKIFDKNTNLQLLSLENNQLQVLSSDLINASNKLQKLNVSANKLTKIARNFLQYIKNAEVINFQDNDCTNDQYEKGSKEFFVFFGAVLISCEEP